jgi:hypothetical protein
MNRLAAAAGILRADVTVHEEARRDDVQLLVDVLADLDQLGPALAAGARVGFVAVFDAFEMGRQGCAPVALAAAGRGQPLVRVLGLAFAQGLETGFAGGNIGGQCLVEQIAHVGRDGFAAGAKA